MEEYGTTFRYRGPLHVSRRFLFCGHAQALLQMDRLFTIDTKAINHVLMNSYDYWKPEGIRYTASRIFGKGDVLISHCITSILTIIQDCSLKKVSS